MSHTFKSAFTLFRKTRSSYVSPVTDKDFYGPTEKTVLRILHDRVIEEYTHADLLHLIEVSLKTRKPNGLNVTLRALRAFGNFCVKYKVLPKENPFSDVETLPVRRQPVRFLSHLEFQLIYNAEPRPVLREVYLVALLTGLRLGDLVALKWENVNLERKSIVISTGKTRKTHTVAIGPALMSCLNRLTPRSAGPLFGRRYSTDYVSHRWKKACKDAGVSDVPFHGLRRTFASWLAEAGCPPFVLRDLMGHSSVTTTDRYYVGVPQAHLVQYISALTPVTASILIPTLEEAKRLPATGSISVEDEEPSKVIGSI